MARRPRPTPLSPESALRIIWTWAKVAQDDPRYPLVPREVMKIIDKALPREDHSGGSTGEES